MLGKSGGEGLDMLPDATATWHGHAKHLMLGMRPAVSHIDEPLMAQPKLREARVRGRKDTRPGELQEQRGRAPSCQTEVSPRPSLDACR